MVKFNSSKLKSLKYKTRNRSFLGIPASNDGVTKPTNSYIQELETILNELNEEIFGQENRDRIENKDLFIFMTYDRLPPNIRDYAIDKFKLNAKAYIKRKVSVNNWTLFLDDERSPDDNRCFVGDVCVVARSNSSARAAVDKLGFPDDMRLDHYLGGEWSNVFLNWLVMEYEDKLDVVPGFTYDIHSMSEHKSQIDEILRPFWVKTMDFYKAKEKASEPNSKQ